MYNAPPLFVQKNVFFSRVVFPAEVDDVFWENLSRFPGKEGRLLGLRDLFKCDRNPFFLAQPSGGSPLLFTAAARSCKHFPKISFFLGSVDVLSKCPEGKRGEIEIRRTTNYYWLAKQTTGKDFPNTSKKVLFSCSHFLNKNILNEKCRKCKQVVLFTFFLGDSNAGWVSGLD